MHRALRHRISEATLHLVLHDFFVDLAFNLSLDRLVVLELQYFKVLLLLSVNLFVQDLYLYRLLLGLVLKFLN